jgi:molecular chaperone DnaK (HSP70)
VSRYTIGIDLGTTNSALAFVDTDAGEHSAIQMLPVPQVMAPGEVAPRNVLPSFCYLAGGEELKPPLLDLPWGQKRTFVIGEFARNHGALVPSRLVSSAKSWLCHPELDRRAPILPWASPDEVQHLSPVEASARYLAHLREAWDTAHPDAPFEEQDVLVAVPASFDAAARELTVEACQLAGLKKLTLLEEPQAAFYSWLAKSGDAWRRKLSAGDQVLVCDIGGGTTDFSLIAVRDEGGTLALERVAVGDHILLGGDNMDLALAMMLRGRLEQEPEGGGARAGSAGQGGGIHPPVELDSWQMRSLVVSVQKAKEILLAEDAPKSAPVTILGRGSKVIGGSIKTELSQKDVQTLLVDGFFPEVPADARPVRGRRMGLQEFGLPYASDAGITRHLARFVGEQGAKPTALLFNGGVCKGEALRARLSEVLASWDATPRLLEGTDLDLAVAHGAAYYGLVRRGRGVRIRGGTARAYYIGIESALPAVPGFEPPLKGLCVAPRGMEEGTSASAGVTQFSLVVGEPVEFRFFTSSVRQGDQVGTLVEEIGTDMEKVTPVSTTLDGPAGQTVPVTIESRVTEVGTLELWCVAKDGRRWRLEYNVREK